ncbi:MAG: SIS domain-containing protein [Bacilli bacterium]|nr:SIS domain-containing protein [Bacilli bacterium]
MIKNEIYDQPDIARKVSNTKIPDLGKYKKIFIIANDYSYNSGLVGKYLIEKYRDIPVDVEYSSEFLSKKAFLNEDTLVMTISHNSNESIEKINNIAKDNGCDTLGIFNNIDNLVSSKFDNIIYTGIDEDSIISGYTAQLEVLAMMACSLAKNNSNVKNLKEITRFLIDIKRLPLSIKQVLDLNETFIEIANDIYDKKNIFVIGKGIDYATSKEGALKLKEIAHVPCEALTSEELKTSLVDTDNSVIGIISNNDNKDSTINRLNKLKSTGANVIYITNRGVEEDGNFYTKKIVLPETSPLLQPIVNSIALQLIAYNISLLDKPKDLKKEF